MQGRVGITCRAASIALAALVCSSVEVSGQDLVPGAYTPAPVGFNLITVSASFSSGGLSFDPTLPIEDAQAKLGAGALGFGRTIKVGGRFASLAVAVPFVNGHVKGLLLGQPQDRWLSGAGDPIFRMAVNLIGAPAMTPAEFAKYRARTVLGVSMTASVPLGQYDSSRHLNIGRNRWAVKPEVGVFTTRGRWTFEGDFGAAFFSDNSNYVNGVTQSQAPIVTMQGHVIYTIRFGFWVAADGNYWRGGRLTTNGIPASQQQSNSRIGLTVALPMGQRQIRIAYSAGALTRLGGDFHSLGASYTHAWK